MDQDIECARLLAAIRGDLADEGIAFAKALRAAKVDESEAGLRRLDTVLRAARGRFKSPDAMLESAPAMQFAHGVGVLLGDAIARRLDRDMHWHSLASAQRLMAADQGSLPDEFATRLVGVVADHMCLPLGQVQSALFDEEPGSCNDYVSGFVARAACWPQEENQWATLYLRSLTEDVALPGGLALRQEVRALGLDWTLESLERIDAWLLALRDRPGFQTEAQRQEPSAVNLWLLLGYYLARTTARCGNRSLKWMTHAEITAHIPDLPLAFESSRGCLIDGAWRLPLVEIVGRLREPAGGSCADFARSVLEQPRREHAIALRRPLDDAPLPEARDWPAVWQEAFAALGDVAAMSIFMVKGGSPLTPTLAVPNREGGLLHNVLMYEDVGAAIQAGLARVDEDDGVARFRLFAYDSYANLPEERLDAITIVLRCHGDKPLSLTLVVPYRPAHRERAFVFYTPRLIECSHGDLDFAALAGLLHASAEKLQFQGFDWRMELDCLASDDSRTPETAAQTFVDANREPAWAVDAARGLHARSGEWVLDEPDWAKPDDIHRLFEAAPRIFASGHVVWGAVVQANLSLFDRLGFAGAGGEVVYDATGRTPWQALHEAARQLMAMKGKRFSDEGRAYISNYLADERIRVFGLDVGMALAGKPLRVSTTWFQRWHLPGQLLAAPVLPIVIAADGSGMVLPLPAPFWPQEALELWQPALAKGASESPHGYVTPPELARAQPMSLTEEGLVYFQGKHVAQDYAKARAAWEKAATEQGNPGAMHGLGQLYEEGLGVAVDLTIALRHYESAVKHGSKHVLEDVARVQGKLGQTRAGARRTLDTALQGEPHSGPFSWLKAVIACGGWLVVLILFTALARASGLTEAGWVKAVQSVMPLIFIGGCIYIWRSRK